MQVYHYVKPQAFNTKHMINCQICQNSTTLADIKCSRTDLVVGSWVTLAGPTAGPSWDAPGNPMG